MQALKFDDSDEDDVEISDDETFSVSEVFDFKNGEHGDNMHVEVEEQQKKPVYNQAGIDISSFLNEDYKKPVPLYREGTPKKIKIEVMDSMSSHNSAFSNSDSGHA